jgi:hypothetical protein
MRSKLYWINLLVVVTMMGTLFLASMVSPAGTQAG